MADLADAEVDDDERDQRDRRQRAEEVDQRIDEERGSCGYQPSTKPTGTATAMPSATPMKTRSVDIKMSSGSRAVVEQLRETRGDRVRRRHQRRIDEARVGDRVPDARTISQGARSAALGAAGTGVDAFGRQSPNVLWIGPLTQVPIAPAMHRIFGDSPDPALRAARRAVPRSASHAAIVAAGQRSCRRSKQLMREFDVARVTVRQAIDLLAREGLRLAAARARHVRHRHGRRATARLRLETTPRRRWPTSIATTRPS